MKTLFEILDSPLSVIGALILLCLLEYLSCQQKSKS